MRKRLFYYDLIKTSGNTVVQGVDDEEILMLICWLNQSLGKVN